MTRMILMKTSLLSMAQVTSQQQLASEKQTHISKLSSVVSHPGQAYQKCGWNRRGRGVCDAL